MADFCTFDSDFNHVLCTPQFVGGGTLVISRVGFSHLHDLQHFLEVVKGHPAVGQFNSILQPGDLRSGSETKETTRLLSYW